MKKKSMTLVDDRLPDGLSESKYLRADEEWPHLQHRLGRPRIWTNFYYQEVLDWLKAKFWINPEYMSFLDLGCGHGNDLRAIRKDLEGEGRFLGVDFSAAEIKHGFTFYKERDNEDPVEARNLFVQGDLRDLSRLRAWNEEEEDFSNPYYITDDEFSLVYMEAVIQAAGLGYGRYREKKASARKYLAEAYRVCQSGGKFFGRITAFSAPSAQEYQFNILREQRNWRFVPGIAEFIGMLEEAGFSEVTFRASEPEKAGGDISVKEFVKLAFLASK